MNVLIKSAKIVDPNSPYNGEIKDILIQNGLVTSIGEHLSDSGANLITYNNLHISPGLFDLRCNLREPGLEQHEDLTSGIAAAEKGGFTGIAIMPDTQPAIDNRSLVEFIINRTKGSKVDVHPIGALSQKAEGKDLAEMYDMNEGGAVAFSDNKKGVSNSNLLSRALLYARNFDGLIMSFPNDRDITYHGQIHEGIVSTKLGLEGIPALSEELTISRDLFLADYNDSKIHIGPISSSSSVSIIKEAKEKGIRVSCDIAAHQIFFTDEACESFDTNYKVLPPFRSATHLADLIEGLKSNIIDIISSDHSPWDVEEKLKEFDLAYFGITNLQTAFPIALSKLIKEIGLESIITKMSINPRTLLKLDIPIVKEGFAANFVLYDPELEWTLSASDLVSKSKNTPFIGTTFTGKVFQTVKA